MQVMEVGRVGMIVLKSIVAMLVGMRFGSLVTNVCVLVVLVVNVTMFVTQRLMDVPVGVALGQEARCRSGHCESRNSGLPGEPLSHPDREERADEWRNTKPRGCA